MMIALSGPARKIIMFLVPRAENIEIVVFAEPKPYIFFEHIGPYFHVERTFKFFHSFPGSAEHQLFSVWLDDPEVTPADELKSRACLLLEPGETIPEGYLHDVLPEGRYAKLSFKGSYDRLPEAWDFLFGLWLPHSGEKAQPNVLGFEFYRNRPTEVSEDQLLTELYIGLK